MFWCCSSDVVKAAKRCIERLALTFIQQRAAAVTAQQAASASASASSGFSAGAARVASSAPTRIQQPPSGEPVTPLVSAAPASVSLFHFTCVPFSFLVCVCVCAGAGARRSRSGPVLRSRQNRLMVPCEHRTVSAL
jgi:hypothetical protein